MFLAQFEVKTWLRAGVLCLALGVALLWPAYRELSLKKAAAAWPTVEGRVDDVEVTRREAKEFVPKVRYSYAVGKETYGGQTFSLGEDLVYATLSEATRAVPAMTTLVKVHYDPEDPSRCALRVDGKSGLLAGTGAKLGLAQGDDRDARLVAKLPRS